MSEEVNENERKIQKAVGSLKKYSVDVSIPIIGSTVATIIVEAENVENAKKRALRIVDGTINDGVDDEGKDIDWEYDNIDNNGDAYVFIPDEEE